MAIQQGGLNQVSAQPKPPPQQVGGKFDAGEKQAENIEEITKSTGLKESVTDDLSDQREAMNNILLRLREGLDNRKNRMFDPVLMQTAAGFLKPTKTGSFGESLGYAAENAGVEAEKEMLRNRENQKLEMELAGKEMELRQQLGGDAFVNKLMGRTAAPAGSAPAGAPAPVTQAPGEAGRTMPPMAPASGAPASGAGQNPQQVLNAAAQGRIKITDEVLLMASRINPKILPTLQEMRRSQETDEKNRIDRERLGVEQTRLGQDKRDVVPRGLTTKRSMDVAEYAEYQAKLKEYNKTGNEKALLQYFDDKGWLEQEQVRNLAGKDGTRKKISDVDYNNLIAKTAQELVTDQALAQQKALAPGEITQAQKLSDMKVAAEIAAATGKAAVEVQRDIDIARGKIAINVEEAGLKETAQSRAKDAEAKATKMATQAELAFGNIIASNDIIAFARSNPRITQAMNQPGVFGALTRAAQEGISFGNFSVNLPAQTLANATLTKDDLTALQMLAQKLAELQVRGRQLNRTPSEGSMSDYETKLLGAIYALPTDSQRALILKSEALKLQSMFDEERFKLWSQKSKKPGYTYNDFMVDDDYKSLKSDYRETLDRVREDNVDLLSQKKPPAASAAPPPAPAASAPAPAASAPPAAPAASAPASAPPTAPPRPAPAAPAATSRPAPAAPVAAPDKSSVMAESERIAAAQRAEQAAAAVVKPAEIITEKKEGFSEKLRRLQK
jgi:hypothetical protein